MEGLTKYYLNFELELLRIVHNFWTTGTQKFIRSLSMKNQSCRSVETKCQRVKNKVKCCVKLSPSLWHTLFLRISMHFVQNFRHISNNGTWCPMKTAKLKEPLPYFNKNITHKQIRIWCILMCTLDVTVNFVALCRPSRQWSYQWPTLPWSEWLHSSGRLISPWTGFLLKLARLSLGNHHG